MRALVDGLPFIVDGQKRAKNILTKKLGKQSETVNAHIQIIMSLPTIHHYHPYTTTTHTPLPTIHHYHPKRIYKINEKLVSHMQALKAMGKLKEINGYTRHTPDKLAVIRADLVRTDDD